MSSVFGKNIKVSVFGQSHSEAIGCTIDTLPAGYAIDRAMLARFIARRAPGQSAYTTPRKESDLPEFICGLLPDEQNEDILVTCGAPLTAIIRNSDKRSSDYSKMRDVPRPSHADYAAHVAYRGFEDVRGGGHFSGRLTAPLTVAGGICLQILEQKGIYVGAHLISVGDIKDREFDPVNVTKEELGQAANSSFPTLDEGAGERMKALIDECRGELDSVGGVIECAIVGLPAGVGSPMFDSLESRMASAIFAVPAVKGIEFGSGFYGSTLKGSLNNDPFTVNDGKVTSLTNNHGGILGGISSGMPVIFRAAFKPTPSIARAQNSFSYSTGENCGLEIAGRHDPCVAVRAVPVIEAVAAAVVLDALLDHEKSVGV